MRGHEARFQLALDAGNVGEKFVQRMHFEPLDFGVVPSYAYTGEDGCKAPRLKFQRRQHAIPDLDVCRSGERFWAEIKTYWHAVANSNLTKKARRLDPVAPEVLVHGIAGRLYRDYLQVEKDTGCPVYVVILEVETGWLLGALLAGLKTWPCECYPCRSGNGRPCIVSTDKDGVKEGVYWRRDDMHELRRFSDTDLVTIRRHPHFASRLPCSSP